MYHLLDIDENKISDKDIYPQFVTTDESPSGYSVFVLALQIRQQHWRCYLSQTSMGDLEEIDLATFVEK